MTQHAAYSHKECPALCWIIPRVLSFSAVGGCYRTNSIGRAMVTFPVAAHSLPRTSVAMNPALCMAAGS